MDYLTFISVTCLSKSAKMDHVRNRQTAFKKIENMAQKFLHHAAAPLDLAQAKMTQTLISQSWRRVEDEHAKALEASVDDTAANVQVAVFDVMFQKYYDLELKACVIIRDLELAAAATAAATVGIPTPATSNIRLPAMELPTFDGSLEDWRPFKDLFQATVGASVHLSGAQKLQYLKSSLKQKAADQISTLPTTDANYVEAWKILCDKYENTREIVQSLIRKILDYRVVKSENAVDLQSLLDNTLKSLRSLKVLGRPTSEWDDLIIVVMISKLDSNTRREWAIRQTGTNLPTLKELEDFLTGHIRGLHALGSNSQQKPQDTRPGRYEKSVKIHHAAAEPALCVMCKSPHSIHTCKEFLRMSPADRSSFVRKRQLCYNCLGGGHQIKDCPSSGTCRQCGYHHHTLLHVSRSSGNSTNQVNKQASQHNKPTIKPSQGDNQRKDPPQSSGSYHVAADDSGILMTAVVTVKDRLGRAQPCRVFIDPGSQTDFVTEECVARLGLQRKACNVGVGGIGGVSAGRSRGKVNMSLASRHNNSSVDVQLLIMPKLTDFLPSVKCQSKNWMHLRDLQLADPEWFNPAPVDIIVGIKHYATIKLDRKIEGSSTKKPTAWETIFGWAIAGTCPVLTKEVNTYHITIDLVDTFLRRFWEVEEPPKAKILSREEKQCETHFQQTHRRDEDGRFIVKIPFNEKKGQLGSSKAMAVARFKQVERRLQRQPQFKEQYVEFMREYISLGHMERVLPNEQVAEMSLYLCHHGVFNESSTTTKMRVVFDGSASTSTGLSLNDCMLVGATLQDDLFDILLRFRTHNIVIKGDITKMFRQFRLDRRDAEYHRKVWRENPEDPLEDYRLLTVTYGTACAPNLSTRCLQQLASDVEMTLPMASKVLKQDAYVDDIMSGGQSVAEVKELYKQLTDAVGTAGMELRKWTSNHPDILKAIPEELRETKPLGFEDDDQLVKALGVQWSPLVDEFTFKSVDFKFEGKVTKRNLYSDLSRVFDPLGFVSCVTIRGKLLLQQLWSLSVGWDEEVPESIQTLWEDYKADLKSLVNVSLPRQIIISPCSIEIHCFCDSSEKSLGYVIYIKTIFPDGTIVVSFVCSKTKVAPLRQVSIPRLELAAAAGGAELTIHVKEALFGSSNSHVVLFMWSDSTITLRWIAGEPRRWKTYVANRVAKIQELTPIDVWRHVPGLENPADLASRGVSAADIINEKFWWQGPAWLSAPSLPTFPTPDVAADTDCEEKVLELIKVHAALVQDTWPSRFSSLRTLKRVAAFVNRFIQRCRTPIEAGSSVEVSLAGPSLEMPATYPTPADVDQGLRTLIKHEQLQYFYQEIENLKKKKEVPVKSKLKFLCPFMDRDGLLRVSGRLGKSKLQEKRRNLIILPGNSHITELLVRDSHQRHHHAGFQFTWAQLGTEYWILNGRNRVRHLLRACVICKRHRAKAAEQLMGQLPTCRVTPQRAFLHSGVDYAGPFPVKAQAGRGWKTIKSWMALFVCMASKAVHLEMVDSLSTEAFLAAFRRFVSRRGMCAHMYSDCGTNFVGADKELQRYFAEEKTRADISKVVESDGVTWHFLPPGAPHHGGLWEAGVKSTKYHLRRVIGDRTLSKEQFSTLLCEIEAVLNSRPLYQRSSDPTDLEALTPGHLLTGEALTAVPTPCLLDVRENRLNQYQLVQNRVQHFWRRWSREYLNTLQQRNKWMWQRENVSVGDLVLLVEETPPATWKMGRIEKLHTGDDGLVRTVTVKTATNSLKRPIVKLVPLLSN